MLARSSGASATAAATAAAGEPRDPKAVRVAGLSVPGSPQAKKVEEAVIAAGATWLGAFEEFERFTDEALASATVIAAQKINGEKLGRNWEKLSALEWFQTWSAGVEHIFRDNKCPQLPSSAITMTNASGAYTEIIAEYVMASVLYFAKELPRRESSRKQGKWDSFKLRGCVSEETFGVVGLGDIGSHSARLAKSFGMRVVATRRRPELSDPSVDRMYSPTELNTMLAECDYVCMATPWTPATDKMLKAEHFAAMKSNVRRPVSPRAGCWHPVIL
jgi:phosphoglycerate dehydrogenase-like enzyme